ncbi:ABC transporter permease subunit [Candidatus Sumerlaeota bacterium]|nr:ABC transporter permease subunit [Candidatus Sumerlaeota bacterium]
MTETSAPREGLTYWQSVRRDFVRNKLAVVSGFVILLIAVVAILCPLLANNRPLYISAVLPDDYNNALQITIEQLSKFATNPSGEERARTSKLIAENFASMAEHLSMQERVKLEELRNRFRGIESKGPPQAAAGIAAALDSFFDSELQPVQRYPALRALTAVEVFLLVVLALCPFVLVLQGRKRVWVKTTTLLGAALLLTICLKNVYPTIQDSTPYRSLVEAPEFQKNGHVVSTLVPYGENENILGDSRKPPTWFIGKAERGTRWHWLGTDTNGRDVLARMVYGARVSMLVSIVAVAIYTVIGMFLGAIAGYFRGWTDIVISRFTEIVICFPPLMVILSVQAFLKPSILNIVLSLAALWWTGVQRLQRGEFLRLVDLDYVQAVRALGGSNLRIITMHILPNALGPMLVMTSFGIAGAILIESALSFLGFGVPQPMASWGDLLNNGRNDITGTWWLTLFPGFAIFLTVTCFNLVGEGFRDVLDPRREH